MPRPTDDPQAREAAARIRAVRSYAGITQQQLADRIGISLASMKRYESGTRPISTDELLQIGDACNAPSQFMLHGYGAIPEAPPIEMPTECLKRFDAHELRIAKLETEMRRVYSDDSPR